MVTVKVEGEEIVQGVSSAAGVMEGEIQSNFESLGTASRMSKCVRFYSREA